MRAFAMSMSSMSTGMPTAGSRDRLRVDERQDHVEVVNHHIEDHVDVGAAALERREPVAFDEAHASSASRAPTSSAGLKRSTWPTCSFRLRSRRELVSTAASALVRVIGFSTSSARRARGRTARPRNAPPCRGNRDGVDLPSELAVVPNCARLTLRPRRRGRASASRSQTRDELDVVERAVLLRMKSAEIPDADDRRAKLTHRARSRVWSCR